MKRSRNIISVILSAAMIFAVTACGQPDDDFQADIITPEGSVTEIQEEVPEVPEESIQTEQEFIDNAWAAFLVSPAQPAYTSSADGYRILDVLCRDSVIGSIASMSKAAEAPEDTVAYDEMVITAGGPVSTDALAFGKLSEVPDSFLNVMVADMKRELGAEYGEHSSGAGMGYRTFYQASYDSDYGGLQVNQTDGYWARTLGAYSEHCAGVAVDFDISYHNSEMLETKGRWNRGSKSEANIEFTWLADNAHKYGFIWRYKIGGDTPTAYGMTTGTIREGWHWRFVGVYNATKFWEKCADDIDGDGVLEGYTKNDDYVWEDYYVEKIHGNSMYPEDMLSAFTEFYNSPAGNRCTYEEYIRKQ